MGERRICEYCNAEIDTEERVCPFCGAQLPDLQEYDAIPESAEEIITEPKTIEELQKYALQKGMPLVRMRFFIGVDYTEPRAFGIYRDGDRVIVYKNKDNGQRAIRYDGTDEQFAVREIFDKLLSECHNRGIYPDAEDGTNTGAPQRSTGGKGETKNKIIGFGIVAFALGFILITTIGSARKHKDDGYYRYGNEYYYRYGNSWSVYDYYYDDWVETSYFPEDSYSSYSIGEYYDDSWAVSDFQSSDVWDDWNSDSSYDYSSSYDSWDSGGTDWGSDW